MTPRQKRSRGSVVITGASTGIGKATALELDSLGFRVFAGVRRHEDGMKLLRESSGRIAPIIIDVTAGETIAEAAETVTRATEDAGLSGLVNNAGIVVAGAVEFLPLEELRKQFEINVIGQVAVIQAFLPLLRKARGRIVNMGSIAGRVADPFISPYAASKHALEAITDALRVELMPWGIPVSIIEPGSIATPLWEKSIAAADKLLGALPSQASELYGAAFQEVKKAAKKTGRDGTSPVAVARAVAHALTARRPKTRYLVGFDARMQLVLRRLLPARLFDRLIARYLGLR